METAKLSAQVGCLAVVIASLGSTAFAQSAANRAVQEAQQYRGTEITIVWEAGLQALDPLNFSGPKWEELTGIHVKVVEVPADEMFPKIMQEYLGGTAAYDALNVVPAWMPDLVSAGALEVLDPYVDRYDYREELQKIAPIYRDNQMTVNGKIYGFPDDGDVLILYYRKDVFDDPAIKSEFMAKHGYELAPPATWKQFAEIGQFLTDKYQPDMYGAAMIRQPAGSQLMFQERFRNEGGRFFDPETMKATVNSVVGVRVMQEMRDENRFMPPGVEAFGFVENLAAFLSGQVAMTISWPPYGRWAAGYGSDQEALSWVPESEVGGKIGYALPPGGHPELAFGFALSVASTSQNQEAAYLFIQWLNSEEISLQRVQLPYALRDPFRDSHFISPEYAARWPEAKEYLAILKAASETGLLDLSLIQTHKYEEALRRGISALWGGQDPKVIVDKVAAEWDEITDQVGVEKQKAAYTSWASKSGAYPR